MRFGLPDFTNLHSFTYCRTTYLDLFCFFPVVKEKEPDQSSGAGLTRKLWTTLLGERRKDILLHRVVS